MTNPSGAWGVLDRYGVPTFILIAVLWAGYKLFWPLLIKQIESSHAIMEKQLESAQKKDERHEARFDRVTAEFLKALEEQRQMTAKNFADLHNRLDRDRKEGKS